MEKQFTEKQLIDFGNYLLSLKRRELFEQLFSYNEAINKLDSVQDIDVKLFNDFINSKQHNS